ncbi:Organic solute transporter subunit alpha [Halotydeus destructor]|nr:Organic solute transporter subunit alpha [Halotydeus destructor]
MSRLPFGFPLTAIHIKGTLNCTDLIEFQYVPTLPEVLEVMGPSGIVMISLACLFPVLITGVFIEEAIKLYKRWPLQIYCLTLAALAVFPISSLCFMLTILAPRAHDINTSMATLYQPLTMVFFYKLVACYLGGEEKLKTTIQGQRIPLTGAPFYFLCRWCPATFMNMKYYYMMKTCVYQLFLAPCFLYFVMGVCSKTGVYIAGQFSFNTAHIYIMVLGTASFCIGVYALVIYYKMAQDNLKGYFICSKYYCLQTLFVLTRGHVLVFDTLGNNHLLPCFSPISAFVYGLYLRTCLMLGWTLTLSLITRVVFLQKPPSGSMASISETVTEVDANS